MIYELKCTLCNYITYDCIKLENHYRKDHFTSVNEISIDPINPKDKIGATKPSLSKVPESAIIYCALAMQNGAEKYGAYNWRDKKVTASIYIDALKRHIASWFDSREDNASDSSVPHLGHAMACIAILIDALETDNLIDNRPKAGSASKLIERWTKTRK